MATLGIRQTKPLSQVDWREQSDYNFEMLPRRVWIYGPALVVCLGCAQKQQVGAQHKADPIRPNIIFIMADDLGYGELGCYGSKQISTPRLDKMAGEGIRFTQAYSGNTLCAPSRCALLTGLHTGHTLVRANVDVPLRPQDKTVAEILKAAGYETGIIGKWGLGPENTTGVPNKKGFDFFYGVLTHKEAHNYYPDFVYRNEQHERTRNVLLRENVSRVKLDYFPDLMTKEAIGFIDRSKKVGKPFFLYLPYTLPHVNNEQTPEHQNEIASLGRYANEPWTLANRGHAAMITYLDSEVGKILDEVQRQGIDKDTIIIFTGDNGPLVVDGVDPVFFKSSGALRGYKRDLYEGGMRVPLIVRWPGHSPQGKISSRPTASWDLMQTFADLAGSTEKFRTDGVSIAPDFEGLPNPIKPKPMYWEAHEGGYKQAVRVGEWKLILTPSSHKIELFDLASDPGETKNVSKEQPELVKNLLQTIRAEWTPPLAKH